MHIIYHIPNVKVGCTICFEHRKNEYIRSNIDISNIEVLEELHDKTDQEAGDIEWKWADKLGYLKRTHYIVSRRSRGIATEKSIKLAKEGNHYFQIMARNGNNPAEIASKNGTHWLSGDKNISNANRIKDGTHNFLGESNPITRLTIEGRNPMSTMAAGRHPTTIKYECPICFKFTTKTSLTRHHGVGRCVK